MRFKNLKQHQHYKDRRPPWIKLHRSLTDDPQYHALDPSAAKYLILAWLIASNDEDGELPEVDKLAFQLRISIADCKRYIACWGAWIDNRESTALSDCKHDDSALLPQRRGEERQSTESEKEKKRTLPPTPQPRKRGQRQAFSRPTEEEVQAYLDELGEARFTGQEFVDANEVRGWKVGRNQTPMKDWKAAVRTWRTQRDKSGEVNPVKPGNGKRPFPDLPDWMELNPGLTWDDYKAAKAAHEARR